MYQKPAETRGFPGFFRHLAPQRGAQPKPDAPRVRRRAGLPARLGDAGQLATVGHVAEANTGNTELAEVSTGTAVDRVAVANADRGGVTGKLLETEARGLAGLVGPVRVDQSLLQLGALRGPALDDDLALLVLGDL